MNSIIIRHINFNKDLPEVVSLLKTNLNQNFSVNFFKWKHLENPAGRSFGLLATHKDKIIGLRMYMFWEFSNDNIKKLAIRPVDTVVDKNYRGKGLFKKLTLSGLDMCKDKFDFIFNTPNSNSLPGYLKMGWNRMENSPILIFGILNPFAKSLNFKETNLNSLQVDKSYINCNLIYQTNKTGEFLQWRYRDDKYSTVQFKDSFMIFTITKLKGFKTIVIYELLGNSTRFQLLVQAVAKRKNAFFIYYAKNNEFEMLRCIFSSKRKSSNVVFKNDIGNVQNNLNFSLGDLEAAI
tara:strand:+ start:105 stop:983 length:879 start_codon:yes stop_codon:yes gene_type:complete